MIASPPFFVATTTCQFSNPVESDLDLGNTFLIPVDGNNQNFQFENSECVTEYGIDEVYLELLTGMTTGSSSASSTDWSVQPVFTGGDILLITFNFIFLAVIIAYFVVRSLAPIAVHKKFLQYHGGDVEVRDDL